MSITPNDTILKTIEYDDLFEYLKNSGWHIIYSVNGKWIVFEGEKDISGNPLEIVLPRNQNASDMALHVASAVNTLCAVVNTYPEDLVLRIRYHDRDVLRVRNPETGDHDSIPLVVASQQVAELKQLVAYSACSEFKAKPFFINAQLPSARYMVEQYRFGHTFRGSFGFTVESPAISKIEFSKQASLIPDLVNGHDNIPLERRVIERIVRGLLITQQSTTSRDVSLIINGYTKGFNANMCQSIVNMTMGKKLPLEYTISWSSRMLPSDELLKKPGPIQLNSESYENLAYAADILSKLEPEEVTIKGLITDLSANDNPLDLDTSRSVIVKWIEDTDGRVYKVFIELSKDDYIKAIGAHREWLSVVIRGTLLRTKNNWRLVNYHDFEVGGTF